MEIALLHRVPDEPVAGAGHGRPCGVWGFVESSGATVGLRCIFPAPAVSGTPVSQPEVGMEKLLKLPDEPDAPVAFPCVSTA